MAFSLSAKPALSVAARTSSRPSRPAARTSVCVQAVQAQASRREMLAASAGLALLLAASPAQAGLFGDDDLVANYTKETESILTEVRAIIALDRDDPAKDDKIKVLRKDINVWVAKYRREPKVSGKPSFGNTYSALNALAGHYNSFGTQAPVPKKRLERLVKELDDANLFLTRNR